MNTIQSIKILKSNTIYYVGQKDWDIINNRGETVEYEVTSIIDNSNIDGKSIYVPIYDIYINGNKKYKTIQNAEVEVTYFV